MADEVIGSPSINLKVRYEELFRGLDAAQRKVASEFEKSNSKLAKAQESTMRQMQAHIDRLSGKRATNEINLLAQAVQAMGGTSKLSSAGVKQLTADVERLAAAGAKVPKALQGLTGGGGKLGGVFSALASGGGISGALAAIGPSGLAAAAGIGAATLAATKLVGAMSDLAGEAEQWSNAAQRTGLSTTVIQQLGAMLEDAGIPAEALTVGMKSLHKEIAEGGKDLAKYGINLASIADLAPEEQMQAVAQAIMNISDENERGAAAQAAFGKQGEALIPVLDQIAAGGYKVIDALGEKQVAALKHLDDELDKAGRSWTAFKNASLGAIAGIINALDRFEDKTNQTFRDRQLRNPITESAADFERRMARIRPEAGGISLGPETPEQAARVKANQERQQEGERASKKLAQDTLSIRKQYNDLQAKIVSRTMDEKDALGFVEDQATAILANQTKIEAANLAALKGTRLREGDMLFGDSGLWTKYQDVIDVELENAAEKTKKVTENTVDWGQSLADVANTMQGLGGKMGGFGTFLAGGVTGVTGIGAGLDSLKTAKGATGLTGLLGKIGSYGQIATSALAIGQTIIGGIKSIFGGGELKREAKEAGAILGRAVTKEQLQALKEEAKAAGKDLKVFLREKKYEEDKARREAEAQERAARQAERIQGLEQAKAGIEAMQKAFEKGDFSEAAKKAFGQMADEVRQVLMQAGMGYAFDARLKESEGYQAAQGLAGGAAETIAGMRTANGAVSAGLMAAGGTIAKESMDAAISAAKAAGLSDKEAQQAGFGAVSSLLREQLNASIASGRELDANTQALIEQAKANGIDIIADPMVESVAVEKNMLAELKRLNSGGRGGYQGESNIPSASGFGPKIAPNMGGGLGPLIQTHAGELVWVLPAALSRRGGIVHAARGYYDDAYDPRTDRQGTSGGGAGGGAADSGMESAATGPVSLAVAAQIQKAVAKVMSTVTPITVKNAPVIQIVDQSVIKTIEGQRAFEQYTVGAVEKALRQNGRSLAAQIDQIAERAARRVVGA